MNDIILEGGDPRNFGFSDSPDKAMRATRSFLRIKSRGLFHERWWYWNCIQNRATEVIHETNNNELKTYCKWLVSVKFNRDSLNKYKQYFADLWQASLHSPLSDEQLDYFIEHSYREIGIPDNET